MTKDPAASECRSGKPENAGHVGSQKLDVPHHFFGGHNPREKDQIEDNLPQPSMSRCPEDDARMRHATVGHGDEVTVACHQDAALHAGTLELPRVGSTVESLLDRRRDIDSAESEAGCDRGVYVLIEVILDIHPVTLAINQPDHGRGPGTLSRPQPSASTPSRHRPECARRSRSGCRGNTPTLHRRRRASNAETTQRSRRANVPLRSRKRCPGRGFGYPQSGAFRRRCPGLTQCVIFPVQSPSQPF